MKLKILTASLVLVLSDISKTVEEQAGINKYQFLKGLLSDTMQVMSVDLDGNEKNKYPIKMKVNGIEITK